MTINEEDPAAHHERLRAALDEALAEYLVAHPDARPNELRALDLAGWHASRSPEAAAGDRERVRDTLENVRRLTAEIHARADAFIETARARLAEDPDRFAKVYGPLVTDPAGEDPVTLWREWFSTNIAENRDTWAAFSNRVHAMLERRGITP